MKLLTQRWVTVAALMAGGLLAPSTARAADLPGSMVITDEAGLFSADAKRQAEQKMSAAKFDRGLHFNVDTHKSLPADMQKEYDATADKAAVMKRWAKSIASGDKAKGPYVLICLKQGWTVVLIDEESVNRGFGKADEDKIRTTFDTAMKDGAHKQGEERLKIRDAALLSATDYVINDMRGTKVVHTDGTPMKDAKAAKKGGGMGIAGWVCIGLVVLLGVWLMIGVIRALTGGGGGGGGYGGGGYGGGGGGGGFMTGLLGGMFGAMAGMWLYNNMLGGHSSYGSDAYASDGSSSGADTGDTGAGDYARRQFQRQRWRLRRRRRRRWRWW